MTSGESQSREPPNLVTRRFKVEVPFGCNGPSSEQSQAPLRWRYDEDTETLRLHVSSMNWTPQEWGIRNGDAIEAVEGFWITRPWSLAESCPLGANEDGAPGMAPVTLPGQTLALAQFFTSDARRSALRDGRAFDSVQRISQEEFDSTRGFRLILTGRIDQIRGRGPVHCIQPGGIEQRPICAVAASFDEVQIENGSTNEVIAAWAITG